MNPRIRRTALSLLTCITLGGCGAAPGEDAETLDEAYVSRAPGSSFRDVRDAVYASPLDTLPQHPGLSTWDIVRNILGSESRPTHGLAIRSRRTLVDESDERPPEPKWLHPRGACAEGRWSIDVDLGGTGLFAVGVDVPAIVRVSSGTADSESGGEGRILGMAIKLFPTTSTTQRVRTRNIVMLDQYGFERSTRRATFVDDDGAPVYFTNVAPAKSPLGRFLSSFFDRFDKPNWARPLYQVARAHVGGSGDLLEYRTPYEIRLQLSAGAARGPSPVPRDFRDELLRLEPTSLDIVLQSWDGDDPVGRRIGRLSLSRFVVSDYCDLNLHFHHDPIEDQLSKYDDYEVVEDLLPE